LITFAVKGFATYGQAVLMTQVGQRIVAGMQNEMFAHVMRADLAFFHDSSTGRLVSRFTNDVNQLRAAVSNALTGIGKDTLTVAALVAVMFYQDWVLAAVSSVVFPLAVLPIVKIGRRMRKVSTNTQEQLGAFTALLSETFQGARHVKAYGMEAYEKSRAAKVIEDVYHLACKAARTRSLSHPIMESLGGIAILLVILYGGSQVITGTRTTGQLFSFITALLLAYEPMKRLAQLNANLQEGLAAAARVFDMLDAKPEIAARREGRRDPARPRPLRLPRRGEGRAGAQWHLYRHPGRQAHRSRRRLGCRQVHRVESDPALLRRRRGSRDCRRAGRARSHARKPACQHRARGAGDGPVRRHRARQHRLWTRRRVGSRDRRRGARRERARFHHAAAAGL
jgi:ABC-type multidrug transport system fused ATPase/permease subunit